MGVRHYMQQLWRALHRIDGYGLWRRERVNIKKTNYILSLGTLVQSQPRDQLGGDQDP